MTCRQQADDCTALQAGMKAMSDEFKAQGSKVYLPMAD